MTKAVVKDETKESVIGVGSLGYEVTGNAENITDEEKDLTVFSVIYLAVVYLIGLATVGYLAF